MCLFSRNEAIHGCQNLRLRDFSSCLLKAEGPRWLLTLPQQYIMHQCIDSTNGAENNEVK